MMKKAGKNKFNKKNLIIGAVSVTLIILFVSLFIVVSPENVVGNAFKTAKLSIQNIRITQAAKTIVSEPWPLVYNTPFYQSPVRAEPDDLLMIPGYGFKEGTLVVYQQITDNPVLSAPKTVPLTNTAVEGQLKVVLVTPDAVTVLLPTEISSKTPYVLWVKNPNSVWSEAVLINDARPQWITPHKAYSTQKYASLPRELKVVGRNLEGYNDYGTHVKLVNTQEHFRYLAYDLKAVNDNNPETSIEHYAAKVELPAQLAPGTYKVQVSRDGNNWVDVPQQLEVLADPAAKQRFDVSTYGCSPSDGKDDASCIAQAIIAAKEAGGGEVYFPAGEWILQDLTKAENKEVNHNYWSQGFWVYPGVDLIGAGADQTKIINTVEWDAKQDPKVIFTLTSDNKVKGLSFDAEKISGLSSLHSTLSIGKLAWHNPQDFSNQVENIIITNCKFYKNVIQGISIKAQGVKDVYIVNNEFQVHMNAIDVEGSDEKKPFYYQDSVIAYNKFLPGDYIDIENHQGTIATQIGSSQRLDFSNNIADGTVNGGWRAGYFWHIAYNHEGTLISQNTATCTGDKTGDGEAIMFDGNGNEALFPQGVTPVAASWNAVSVNEDWFYASGRGNRTRMDQTILNFCPSKATTFDAFILTQEWYDYITAKYPTYFSDSGRGRSVFLVDETNGKRVINPDYFKGYWVMITDGKGLGQARKIVDYTVGKKGIVSTFKVEPAWDVIPDQTSKITISKSVWNVYMVDNLIDARPCQHSNRYMASSGIIGWWSRVTDSTIEGNKQYDTNGIVFLASHQCGVATGILSIGEIRNNLVDGECDINKFTNVKIYDPDYDKKYGPNTGYNNKGGISLWTSADPDIVNPVIGYGISVSHNTVRAADTRYSAAISIEPGWTNGLNEYLLKNNLIFHNSIEQLPKTAKTGIYIHDSHIWNTVLYKNVFENIAPDKQIIDNGKNTIKVS